MRIRDRQELSVGGGLGVGQLVHDVPSHDVLGENVLAELVEDVQLLRVSVRNFENSVGLFRRDARTDGPEPVVADVGDVKDPVRGDPDGRDGAELDVGGKVLQMKAQPMRLSEPIGGSTNAGSLNKTKFTRNKCFYLTACSHLLYHN